MRTVGRAGEGGEEREEGGAEGEEGGNQGRRAIEGGGIITLTVHLHEDVARSERKASLPQPRSNLRGGRRGREG